MKQWKPGRVKLATDALKEKIKGKSVALMMNTSAITNEGKLLLDTIVEEKWADVKFFFGMEHGVRGNFAAGDANVGSLDEKTGIRIVNLYEYPRLKPPVEFVEQVDAVIFCAQDVGVRHWTYTPWMLDLIDAAAAADREVFILDRPNPIRGDIVEGEMAKKYVRESLVSGFEYPLRHGMTIGELALMYNDIKNVHAKLTVLPMEGWKRDMWYDETGLIWLPPSPNMPTLETAQYFAATGLMQSSNFSLGIGTTTPFQFVGSPKFCGDDLAAELNSRDLDGVYFVQKYYTARVSEYTATDLREYKLCDGVMLVIEDRNIWKPVKTQIHIMDALLKLYPDFVDLEPKTRAGNGNYARQRMCTDDICERFDRRESVLPLIDLWQRSSEAFMKQREPYLLY